MNWRQYRPWLAATLASGRRATPRWAQAAVALAVLLLAARAAEAWRERVRQPIAFNHRVHTGQLQLDCDFCHQFVRTGAHPGLPSLETCATCHAAVQGRSREAARVTDYVTAGRPLVFVKLFRLPRHVFYTHRRHVGIANLACRTCHGDIALTTSPPARPLVRIRMRFCVDCHRRMGQSTDCIACHR